MRHKNRYLACEVRFRTTPTTFSSSSSSILSSSSSKLEKKFAEALLERVEIDFGRLGKDECQRGGLRVKKEEDVGGASSSSSVGFFFVFFVVRCARVDLEKVRRGIAGVGVVDEKACECSVLGVHGKMSSLMNARRRRSEKKRSMKEGRKERDGGREGAKTREARQMRGK